MRYTVLCLCCAIFTMFSSQTTIAQSPEIIIFAASSLTDSFSALAEQFEQEYNVQITLNFAGSSTLAAQLLQGAPVDVFASANPQQMQSIIDDNLIDENAVTIFAENELIIIVPSDNPANIESAQDLATDNVKLVLAAPSVPIREYSNQLLESLIPIYGNGYVDDVFDNLVSEESNVRQIAARVTLGEADAGIVYRTDVTPDIAEDVLVINVPKGTSPRANYLIAPLSESENLETARLFIEFVLSESGQSILSEWGFCSPQAQSPELTPEAEITPEIEVTPEINENQELETPC